MPIISKKPENDGNFELIPEGTHQAVCYAVWDLGIQKSIYQGKESLKPQIIISWEVDIRIQAEGKYKDKRMVVSKKYTNSLSEKAHLFNDLTAWRGRAFTEQELDGFDVEATIGANCYINITHKKSQDGKKTYVNVSAVMALPKGAPKFTTETPPEPPDWVKKVQGEQVQVNPEKSQPEASTEPDIDISKVVEHGKKTFKAKEVPAEDHPEPADDDEIPF